jgi:hypothetical protein
MFSYNEKVLEVDLGEKLFPEVPLDEEDTSHFHRSSLPIFLGKYQYRDIQDVGVRRRKSTRIAAATFTANARR